MNEGDETPEIPIPPPKYPFVLNLNDRRLLRSLKIDPDK